MAFEELNERNLSEGLHILFIYANDVTGNWLVPLILMAFFGILGMGSFFASERMSGQGDFAVSFAVAGFSTFGLTLIMSLAPGLIRTTEIITVLAIAIMGFVFLYFSKKE